MIENDKTYFHTSVNIEEYEFPKIYIDNVEELVKYIQVFNSSKDINEKRKYIGKFPNNFLPKCRICGNLIINDNSQILYNLDKKYIQIKIPQIQYRKINNKEYYLSCCQQCLYKHFENNQPKSPKYIYMKANKYGAFAYGYGYDEYKRICSMTVGVTKKSMTRKWGNIEGLKRWKEYCNKQSVKNTFAYKKKKYGWTKEKFDEFNKSRAVTLENMQNKYGNELGKEYFDDYVEKQKITKSKEYMISKFGLEKTVQINKSKGFTLENYINRYGNNKGTEKFKNILYYYHQTYFSKVSQKFFNELDTILGKKYTTYYASKNKEYGIILTDNTFVKLDYFIKELNLCIEFNGTYWHADPRKYKSGDRLNPNDKNSITANEIWENDNKRYQQLKLLKNINTIVVWEDDYMNGLDINQFIKEVLKISI